MKVRVYKRRFTFVETCLVLVNIIGIALAVNLSESFAEPASPEFTPQPQAIQVSAESTIVEDAIVAAAERGYIASPDVDLHELLTSEEFHELRESVRNADTAITVSAMRGGSAQ